MSKLLSYCCPRMYIRISCNDLYNTLSVLNHSQAVVAINNQLHLTFLHFFYRHQVQGQGLCMENATEVTRLLPLEFHRIACQSKAKYTRTKHNCMVYNIKGMYQKYLQVEQEPSKNTQLDRDHFNIAHCHPCCS